MNTEMLHKEFEKIAVLENRAKIFYDHYIDQIDDEDVKEQLISIRDEEIEHIEIAKELIELLS